MYNRYLEQSPASGIPSAKADPQPQSPPHIQSGRQPHLTSKEAPRPSGGDRLETILGGTLKSLSNQQFDVGDILLVLIILLLFLDGDDLEVVITLALMLLLGLGDS